MNWITLILNWEEEHTHESKQELAELMNPCQLAALLWLLPPALCLGTARAYISTKKVAFELNEPLMYKFP